MTNEYDDRAMRDNYLWDGSGAPDPEIQHLERALGRFQHNRPIPSFPQFEVSARRWSWWSEIAASAWTPRCAAALLVVFAIGPALWSAGSPRSPAIAHDGWDVQVTPASQDSETGGPAGKNTRLK